MASDLRIARHKLNKQRAEAGQPPLALPTTGVVSPLGAYNAQRALAQHLDAVLKSPTLGGHQTILLGPKGRQVRWGIPPNAKSLPTAGGSVVVRDASGAFHLLTTRNGRAVELVDPAMIAKLRPELEQRFAKISTRGDK
jgi:hypothetical protein